MNKTELMLNDISDALYGLLDADALPNISGKPDVLAYEYTKDDIVYALVFSYSLPNIADIINVYVDMEHDEMQVTVADSVEMENDEYLLPGLKDYLLQHPSLQYEDVISSSRHSACPQGCTGGHAAKEPEWLTSVVCRIPHLHRPWRRAEW